MSNQTSNLSCTPSKEEEEYMIKDIIDENGIFDYYYLQDGREVKVIAVDQDHYILNYSTGIALEFTEVRQNIVLIDKDLVFYVENNKYAQFVIEHELGHVFFYHGREGTGILDRTRKEYEANMYALSKLGKRKTINFFKAGVKNYMLASFRPDKENKKELMACFWSDLVSYYTAKYRY